MVRCRRRRSVCPDAGVEAAWVVIVTFVASISEPRRGRRGRPSPFRRGDDRGAVQADDAAGLRDPTTSLNLSAVRRAGSSAIAAVRRAAGR